MPKDTFNNLPEDKRQRIIDIAVEEFAIFDYRTSSLSRIVEKAGIAKGSMYQYFESKTDLYIYIVEYVSQKKLEYINKNLNISSRDFYEMYKQMIFVSSKFGLDYPLFSQVGYNAFKESYNEEIGDMSSKLLKMSREYIREFVLKAQEQGQIRTDIELDLIAFIISQLSVDIGDYITDKFNFTYTQMINGQGKLPITDEQLEEVIDDLIKFFKNGLELRIND